MNLDYLLAKNDRFNQNDYDMCKEFLRSIEKIEEGEALSVSKKTRLKAEIEWPKLVKEALYILFPFLEPIPFEFDGESFYHNGQLHLTMDGISSPYESVLHELGHCFYYMDCDVLERIRFKGLGFHQTTRGKSDLNLNLRVNPYNNEVMAAAYQLRMMFMAGLSDHVTSHWLDSFTTGFSEWGDGMELGKLKTKKTMERMTKDILKAVKEIGEDDIISHVNGLTNCLKSERMSVTRLAA